MTIENINQQHTGLLKNIFDGNLKPVFDSLDIQLDNMPIPGAKQALENSYFTYQNMLKYSFESDNDPEREKIYNGLCRDLLALTDKTKQFAIEKNQRYAYLRFKNGDTFKKIQNSIDKEEGLSAFQQALNIDQSDKKPTIYDLYEYTCVQDDIDDKFYTFFTELVQNEKFPWQFKALLVNAIMVSVFRYFDEKKADILLLFLRQQQHEVWQRALVALVLMLLMYNKRLAYYPGIAKKIKVVKEEHNLEENIELIMVQFIRAQDTERVAKKIQEEIMPDMIKMRSKLTDKLNLDKINSLEELHEKNPEWEVMFEDTPDLYDKVEKISKMHMEGVDVFHSAFSMLKHFPFFNHMANWFLPFFKENEEIIKIFDKSFPGKDLSEFLEGLERSGFMCNSDKYSFCYNVHMLPDEYKNQLIKLFDLELNAMNEMATEDELINEKARNKFIFNQYIQDLYRFYKVYPKRNEFFDVFSLDIDFTSSEILKNVLDNEDILRNIGEFYFENEHYDKSIRVFGYLIENGENVELYEKIGYAYQKLSNFNKAVQYYTKAEFLDGSNIWVLKKLGYCHRVLKNYSQALQYYQRAEKNDPENLQIQASLGNLYMDMGDFHNALQKYYKVEYLSPNNLDIVRPLAWCCMQVGKLSDAHKYLLKINEKTRNPYDWLNLGHIEWGMGDKQKAVSYYGIAVNNAEKGMEWFINEMYTDSDMLTDLGVSKLDIRLMVDYLHFNK